MSTSGDTETEDKQNLVVISGVRASGRTLSLRLLEDCGYTGTDNIPPGILPRLVEDSLKHRHEKALVIAIETRTPEAVGELVAAIGELRKRDLSLVSVFLDASDTTLLDRIGHRLPKDSDARKDLRRELLEDRRMTRPVRNAADIVLDTSRLSPVDVKERLIGAVDGRSLDRTMRVEITSFGFKYAAFSADMIFDVRFIPNPYYVSELRPLTGRDKACNDFVFRHEDARMFVDTVSTLIRNLIPSYIAQGRSVLRIGIGCTGGRHRSVVVAEALGQGLSSAVNRISVHHRELSQHPGSEW